jgi:K+-transporting ATPase ATPase A chain
VLAGAMAAILLGATAISIAQEQAGNRALTSIGVSAAGGNMEGKEVRFGPILSGQFFAAATGSGDGDVDGGYDSLMPATAMVGRAQMKLGEVTPGGPGSGLYGILILAITAVFMAGLMVGRTPEYLGKKIESHEMKLVALAILAVPSIVLLFSAVAVLTPQGKDALGNPGPHGLSEILYAFVSTAVNNGSSFAGLSGNNLFYNVLLGISMWAGRFGLAIPVLALAGSLAQKRLVTPGAGTLPTDSVLFGIFLVAVLLIVGGLTFFVTLALAPILKQLHLVAGGLYH